MPHHTSSRLPGLDTLRALAILAVMLFHLQLLLPEVLAPAAQFGWMGVDLFFVLSGYLIGSQFLRPLQRGQRPSLPDFYRRRAFRILPAYLVVLGLYVGFPLWREQAGLSPIWQFLTFTLNLFIDYEHNQAFSHAWSLCVEEHFYLLLPVITLIALRRITGRRTIAMLGAIILGGMALRGWILVHSLRHASPDDFGFIYLERLYYPTWCRLDGLVAGVALALVQLFRPAWWRVVERHGHASLLTGIALFAACLPLFVNRFDSDTGAAAWGIVVGYPLLALAFTLLTASALSLNGWLARWRVPGATALATLSYGLYLIHKAVVHLDRLLLPSLTAGRGALSLTIYAVTSLAAAALMYFAVERPFLQLRHWLDARSSTSRERNTTTAEEILHQPAL